MVLSPSPRLTDSTHTPQDPGGRARPVHHDAVVVGGGAAGLAAAWELCQHGLRPLLVEARGYTGGLVARGEVAGVALDLGAEGFVLRGTAVSEIAQACGLEVVPPSGGGAHLFLPPLPGATRAPHRHPAGGWELHPFPADSFLGVPADPQAADVRQVLGPHGARRAAQDARLGPLVGTGPHDPADLAAFVRARMGQAVLERLVRPIVAGIHTADPADLAADNVAPGLRDATRRLGSLQAAVAELLAQRRARQGGRTVDVTTVGGLSALTQAMRTAVQEAGGQVRTRTGAQVLRPAASGGWELELTPTGPGPTPSAEPVPTGGPELVSTPLVVVACSAGAAQRLLRGAGVAADLSVPEGSPIARLTLVARSPGLDAAPVGSGLLVAPVSAGTPPVAAKALSHLSRKWPWVGRELRRLHGPHTHALRLSYGRPGQPRPEVSLAQALTDVEALTGVRINPEQVVDHKLVRWDGTLPPISASYLEQARAVVGQAEARPGLGLTGAWVAGSGIASVVAHARAQAARLAATYESRPPETGTSSIKEEP